MTDRASGKMTGEPDQFEQILKDYCAERFGEPRPAETVWQKLAFELEAESDEADAETGSTYLPGSTRSTSSRQTSKELTPEPTSLPAWRKRGNFALVAGLAVAAIAGLVVIALVLATAGNNSGKQTSVAIGSGNTANPVPSLTPQPNNALNLSNNALGLTYPGAKMLTIDPNDPWPVDPLELPADLTRIVMKAALATPDAYSKVIEYYRQLLTKNGYTLPNLETGQVLCENPTAECPSTSNLTATKGPQQITFIFLSPQSWLTMSSSTYLHIGEQAKTTDTVVLITVAGEAVTVTPSATSNGATAPAATLAPELTVTPTAASGGNTNTAFGLVNLLYPQAAQLKVDPQDPWPSGKLTVGNGIAITQKAALATPDGFTQVSDYYRQVLTKNGFTITASEETSGLCEVPPCPPILTLAATRGTEQVGLMVLSPESWLPLNLSTYMHLGEQTTTGNTIVMISLTGPDAAVAVSPPPMGDVEPAVTVAPPPATIMPETPTAATASLTVTPTVAAGYPDLTYAGAKQLTVKPDGPWITGQLDLSNKTVTGRIALASADSYTSIVVYYQQLLGKAGFGIKLPNDVPTICDPAACYVQGGAIKHFTASKGKLYLEVMTFEAKDWNSAPDKLAEQLNLAGQITPPDTLVLITLASDN